MTDIELLADWRARGFVVTLVGHEIDVTGALTIVDEGRLRVEKHALIRALLLEARAAQALVDSADLSQLAEFVEAPDLAASASPPASSPSPSPAPGAEPPPRWRWKDLGLFYRETPGGLIVSHRLGIAHAGRILCGEISEAEAEQEERAYHAAQRAAAFSAAMNRRHAFAPHPMFGTAAAVDPYLARAPREIPPTARPGAPTLPRSEPWRPAPAKYRRSK